MSDKPPEEVQQDQNQIRQNLVCITKDKNLSFENQLHYFQIIFC